MYNYGTYKLSKLRGQGKWKNKWINKEHHTHKKTKTKKDTKLFQKLKSEIFFREDTLYKKGTMEERTYIE